MTYFQEGVNEVFENAVYVDIYGQVNTLVIQAYRS